MRALVVALDRWGRVLLEGEGRDGGRPVGSARWSIPGGSARDLEVPDECALRVFEEATGCLLEHLELFRVFRTAEPTDPPEEVLHVYFDDPDLEPGDFEVRAGRTLRYFEPAGVTGPDVDRAHRRILGEFVGSSAYRALFH